MYVPKIDDVIESVHFSWDPHKSAIYNIHEYIKVYLKITDPHDKLATRIYEHTMRSVKLAEKIMSKELADKEVVTIALLLHDIGKTLCDNSHNLISYKISEIFLNKYYQNADKRKQILDCILFHSAKDLYTLDLTTEQKVVMDADILDEIGLLLMSRVCIRTPNKNCSIHEIIRAMDLKYIKVDKETCLLKTKYGASLYCQKKKKFKEQIDQLKSESIEFRPKK